VEEEVVVGVVMEEEEGMEMVQIGQTD